MPPKEIFIVRHGERLDKKDPGYSQRTTRPHDPPLTPNGVGMAETLGAYLHSHYSLKPSDVVVLSSPLLRCVQTSAGIVRGLCGSSKSEATANADPSGDADAGRSNAVGGPEPAIFVEPCLVESLAWQFIDLRRNPAVARDGFLKCPTPLWLPVAEMQTTVSPHVRLQRPYQVAGLEPVIRINDDKLTEEDFEGRCLCCAQLVATSTDPSLAGKVVICVSHGEASQTWFDSIASDPASIDKREDPAYTAFMHLKPSSAANGGAVRWNPELPKFSTPHLPEKPSEY